MIDFQYTYNSAAEQKPDILFSAPLINNLIDKVAVGLLVVIYPMLGVCDDLVALNPFYRRPCEREAQHRILACRNVSSFPTFPIYLSRACLGKCSGFRIKRRKKR